MIREGSIKIVFPIDLEPTGGIADNSNSFKKPEIAVIPWFYVNADGRKTISTGLKMVASSQKPIDVLVGRPELSIADDFTPTMGIINPEKLRRVHLGILDIINKVDAEFQASRYNLGPSFWPHVENKAGSAVEQGSVFTLARIAVVNFGEDGTQSIVETYPLGQQVETAA